MTRLDRAVDAAIADENRRFLADPVAIAEAQAEGELYRQRIEGRPAHWPPPCGAYGQDHSRGCPASDTYPLDGDE